MQPRGGISLSRVCAFLDPLWQASFASCFRSIFSSCWSTQHSQLPPNDSTTGWNWALFCVSIQASLVQRHVVSGSLAWADANTTDGPRDKASDNVSGAHGPHSPNHNHGEYFQCLMLIVELPVLRRIQGASNVSSSSSRSTWIFSSGEPSRSTVECAGNTTDTTIDCKSIPAFYS